MIKFNKLNKQGKAIVIAFVFMVLSIVYVLFYFFPERTTFMLIALSVGIMLSTVMYFMVEVIDGKYNK